MGNLFLTHDIGTSCDKASLLDTEGNILRSNSEAYPIHFSGDGWAEQDPDHWWSAFCKNNRVLLEGIDPREILGVSASGQMMTCLPVDREGRVLHPAIIWADGRATAETAEILERIGLERFYGIVGMRPSANYSLPKFVWLKRNRPDIYRGTYKFLGPKDYINLRLSGLIATDPEEASYMHLLDMHARTWSDYLLETMGLDREKLPDILPCGTVLGEVTAKAAEACGLLAGTPVILTTGDGDTATLGAGVVEIGDAYTSIGTSSWVSILTGKDVMDPTCSIAKVDCFGTWRDSGTMQAGGYSYSWLKDTLCLPETEQAQREGTSAYRLIDELAASVPTGSGGTLFLPHLMGERTPYWDPKLRGAFLGLGARTTRAHLCRSVLEGVAMHLGLILRRIREVNQPLGIRSMCLVGGGSGSPLWRQIFADVYNLPVTKTRLAHETGTLGNAVLIGMALGIYKDIRIAKEFQKVESVTEPIPENVRRYQQLQPVFEQALQNLVQTNHDLTALS